MKKSSLIVIRVFTALVIWFIIHMTYSTFIDPMLDGSVPELLRMALSAMVVPYTLGIGACYLVLKGMAKKGPAGRITATPTVFFKGFAVQTGLAMPVMILLNVICILFGISRTTFTPEMLTGEYWLFYVILLLGFAPVVEEILFRKLALDRLLVIGETPAIIISAVFFGLPHLYSQGLPQMFGTFTAGLVWAYMRTKTGKMWPSMIMHIMFNIYGAYFVTFMSRSQPTTALYVFLSIIVFPVTAILILIFHFVSSKKRILAVNTVAE